jgi:hypothetical protein
MHGHMNVKKLYFTMPESVDFLWYELPLFYNIEVSANKCIVD